MSVNCAIFQKQVLIGDNNVPSQIKRTLAHCRTIHGGIEIENVQIDRFDETLTDKLNEYQEVLGGVNQKLQKIRGLQQLIEYFKILQEIENIR